MYRRMTAITGAAVVALGVGAASANTISVVDVVDDTDPPYVSVTCVPDCHGIDYLGMESDQFAEAVPGVPADEATIVASFSELTGISTDLVSVDYKVDDEVSAFSVGPGFFFVKKASWTAFFVAKAETSVTTSDTISNYGEIDVVPGSKATFRIFLPLVT
jgi:hypothetical protein